EDDEFRPQLAHELRNGAFDLTMEGSTNLNPPLVLRPRLGKTKNFDECLSEPLGGVGKEVERSGDRQPTAGACDREPVVDEACGYVARPAVGGRKVGDLVGGRIVQGQSRIGLFETFERASVEKTCQLSAKERH